MKTLKLGVLGAGRGLSVAISGKELKDFSFAALCDKNLATLEKSKNELRDNGFDPKKITFFSDYGEMLKSDIDAVFVASGVPQHVEHVVMALNAGKHVLSEIPTV